TPSSAPGAAPRPVRRGPAERTGRKKSVQRSKSCRAVSSWAPHVNLSAEEKRPAFYARCHARGGDDTIRPRETFSPRRRDRRIRHPASDPPLRGAQGAGRAGDRPRGRRARLLLPQGGGGGGAPGPRRRV